MTFAPPWAVVLSRAARTDLDSTTRYLTQQAGERVADRFLRQVEQTTKLLAEFPRIGVPSPTDHSALSSLRRHPLGGPFSNWLVFYALSTSRVDVLRLLRGEQNWARLFNLNPARQNASDA